MCGITGYAGFQAAPEIILSMMDAIKHRGPDGDGYCLFEEFGIGMKRLSIVDIAGGSQPIHSRDGNFSIVFNGEIYNHRELSQDLISQGITFKTRSDTEVILALYEKFAESCVDKLRGMFSFSILDRRNRSIFIARDRVGVKPLYFWQSGRKLIFASEVKSILASNQYESQINDKSLYNYLTLRYVPGPETLFADINKLSPGHWMKWEDGKLTTKCYWQSTIRPKSNLPDSQIQEQFNVLFEESVDYRRMGDVPHGAYLSGGIDSAAVVNALKNLGSNNINSFTVGFNWAGDELSQARETAKLLGTNHHEIIYKPEDLEFLPKIVWHSDEPLGDPIVLPTYLLAKEASQHVKIVLTGEGADEILGGYLFHKAVFISNIYHKFPDLIHNSFIKPILEMMPVSVLNAAFNYPGYLGDKGKKRLLNFIELSRKNDPSELIKYFITLFDKDEKDSLLNKDFISKVGNISDSNNWQLPKTGSNLDKSIRLQYYDWLPDNILMRQDKMSMAHGLEARVPFLDHKLIEFIETVPDHLKLNLFKNKVLLRNYASKNLIGNVSRRKKKAFYFPMELYFGNKVFQELLSNTLSDEKIKSRGILKPEAVKDLITKMQQKDFLAAKQVFSLISLELWQQIFIDKKFKFQ